MKRGWGLLLLFAILLCLLASCIDPEKTTEEPETTVLTESAESEEGSTDPAHSTQPTIPNDPGWTKPY